MTVLGRCIAPIWHLFPKGRGTGRHPVVARPTPWSVIVLAVTALTTLTPTAVFAQDIPLQPFFGDYLGRTLFPMGEQTNRDLWVSIRPYKLFGFTVEWATTQHKQDKSVERKSYILNFYPTSRLNLYSTYPSIETADEKGFQDPAQGVPYAWARLENPATMTVNVLTIMDDGTYALQTYKRTLTADGIALDFTRILDGTIERQIKGNLTRQQPIQ